MGKFILWFIWPIVLAWISTLFVERFLGTPVAKSEKAKLRQDFSEITRRIAKDTAAGPHDITEEVERPEFNRQIRGAIFGIAVVVGVSVISAVITAKIVTKHNR